MHREGDYEEYKAHGISETQEAEWRESYRKDLLNSLMKDPSDGNIAFGYCRTIDMRNEEQLIEPLLCAISEMHILMDSFSKLLNAEALFEAMSKTGIASTIRIRIKKLIDLLVNAVISEPEKIDKRYHDKKYLKGVLERDIIIARARKLL